MWLSGSYQRWFAVILAGLPTVSAFACQAVARAAASNVLAPQSVQKDTPATASAQLWHEYSIGTRDTLISLGVVDPHGRWVFFCQSSPHLDVTALVKRSQGARSGFLGPDFVPYFASVNSEPAAIQSLLASSADGRFVVVSRGQGPELLDIETGKAQNLADLDLDSRADVLPGDLRSIAFSPKSDKIAFLVHEKRPRVVVLGLLSPSRAEVTPVGDTVWRIGFDASAQYLVLQEVLEDSNRNGRLSWPLPEGKLSNTRCRAPVPAFPTFVSSGDAVETTIAPVTGGNARRTTGFMTGLGRSVVVKSPDGALSYTDGPHSHAFGSSDCNAQVVAIAPENERLLVGCRNDNGRATLEIDSLTGSQQVNLDVPTSSVDRTLPELTPYIPVYSGARTALVDLAAARVVPLEDRDQILAQGKAGVVIRRGSMVVLRNLGNQKETRLLDSASAGTRLILGAGVVALGKTVVSAEDGRVLGKLEKPVFALASNGCGLVMLGEAHPDDPLPRGPLGWRCPEN